MKTGAVIAAAGLSSRMNSFKPLLQLGGSTIIRTIITTLQAAGIEEITVVTGNEADLLTKHLSSMNVACVHNPNFANKDMFCSVCIGLDSIRDKCDRVFFLPTDVPLFSSQSLFTMLGYMDCNQCKILLPIHKGKTGHPILIDCSIVPEITAYKGPDGLKGAIQSFSGEKAWIALDDAGITLDADKPENYEKLTQYVKNETKKSPLDCTVKVEIKRRQFFFNSELCTLLQLVQQHHSLNKACEEMGMAYSRGWKAVKIAEYQLGFLLLDSRTGGNYGGGSTLTPKGMQFIQDFIEFYEQVDRQAKETFSHVFADYLASNGNNPV